MSINAFATETACSHRFAGTRGEVNHYCTYIKPHRFQNFPDDVKNPDDFILYSLFSSSIIWFDLIASDLTAVSNLWARGSGLGDGNRVVIKRLRRANTCLDLVETQCRFANAHLSMRDGRHRSRSVTGFAADLPSFRRIEHLAASLQDYAVRNRNEPASSSCTNVELLMISAERTLTRVRREIDKILSPAEAHGTTPGRVHVLAFVDGDALIRPAQESLRKHHPQALQEDTTHDELTFIKAHQAFELWFPTVLVHINSAADQLTDPSPGEGGVEFCVNRVAQMLRLFEEMIRTPQSMTAMDYLAFRGQLSGSGAESIGFRLIELALGQRDRALIDYLHKTNLVTDEIERQLARPSLYSAFLSFLKRRGVIAKDDDGLPQALAFLMRPTAERNSHADVMWIAEAMLDVEQSLDRWRTAHLSMVDRMIGYRKSLGVGTQAPGPAVDSASSQCPNGAAAVDARPYLVRTLEYRRMFPALWEARHLLMVRP